jgi:Fe-Mn family superoxide dismutase
MSYKLPPLPYAYDALEPYIDAKTMEIHYTKHHQAYIDELNKLLEKHPQLQTLSLEQLLEKVKELPEEVATPLKNNGGGTYNHSLFWEIMQKNGGGTPKGNIGEAITTTFGSFEKFKELFSAAAKSRFGSGWAWLSLDSAGKLVINSTPNQDNPLMSRCKPIMGLDVWEHAYYLKYQNKRVDYIAAWWHVVNWDRIDQELRKHM